jgi:hypothetical protein
MWSYFINKQADSLTIVETNMETGMANYQRSTRECSVTQLQPKLMGTIRDYFRIHELGELETETILCCETISEKKETSWLESLFEPGADQRVYSAILLTGDALIWARAGARLGAHANGASLHYIRVNSSISLFSKNNGLTIAGLIDKSPRIIRGTIALGPELAAQKFCEEVQKAVEKLNPAPVRKWPAWLGGR